MKFLTGAFEILTYLSLFMLSLAVFGALRVRREEKAQKKLKKVEQSKLQMKVFTVHEVKEFIITNIKDRQLNELDIHGTGQLIIAVEIFRWSDGTYRNVPEE